MSFDTHIVALGDSLTEGFGVGPGESYPVRLEALLNKKGFSCSVINAGCSGDTCRNLMARMHRVSDFPPDLVILEIGLNDILMGAMPERIRHMISTIVQRLTARAIPVVLAGMVLPSMGDTETEKAFAAIYPAVAQAFDLVLIPSFNGAALEETGGVQFDGIHPTAAGYAAITAHILPWVVQVLDC
ncbi:MAG: arylesterase [Deltaproteobacteria bacterium]|nr:arylesterase [Deltaproteobacteria bacterium]